MGYYLNGTISAGDEVILNLPRSIEVSSVYQQNNRVYLATSRYKLAVNGQNLDCRTSD